MSEYFPTEISVDVPLNTGVEGFLLALRKILALSRVTDIHINSKGRVTYKRWVREDDDSENNVDIDFETVSPYAAVRNSEIEDLGFLPDDPAISRIAYMFHKASADQLYPVAFVTGADTVLGAWFKSSSNIDVVGDQFYGLPLVKDRQIGDDVLLLCVAYGRGASIVDIRKSYKIVMPGRDKPIMLVHGGTDEAVRGDSEGGTGEPERTDRAPEMGSPGTQPAGRPAGLPGVPGAGGPRHRTRPAR